MFKKKILGSDLLDPYVASVVKRFSSKVALPSTLAGLEIYLYIYQTSCILSSSRGTVEICNALKMLLGMVNRYKLRENARCSW